MKLTYGLVGKAAIRDNTTLFMYYGIKILPYNNYLVYLHCKNIQTYGFMTKVIHVHLFNGRKNYYFVPFGQDNAQAKPSSLVADFSKIPETVEAALRGEQIQPLLLR